MEHLRLTVHKKREQIEVSADLIAGWRKLEKWWGFDETVSQPFGDEAFQCFVMMVLWSRSLDLSESASYPPDGKSSTVSVVNGQLDVVVPLDEGWGMSRRGHPLIRVECELPILQHAAVNVCKTISVRVAAFKLELGVVKVPPRSMTLPDFYEFGDGHALIGGLPGTNRRH